MRPLPHARLLLVLSLAAAVSWLGACTTALGPGYAIDSQEIHVQFDPVAPKIHLDCVYQLRNAGNQPLQSLELRLPGRLSFQVENAQFAWDGQELTGQTSSANPRDTLFRLPGSWKISERRSFHVSSDFVPATSGATHYSFASDAFFLPSEGWAPELLPARGFIAAGGVPPKRWPLTISVPENFLVHTSGKKVKSSRQNGRMVVQAVQTLQDRYPFVVAGNYRESSLTAGQQKVFIWSRAAINAAGLQDSAAALSKTLQAFDQTFGSRTKTSQPLWLVECPAVQGCFTTERSLYAEFVGAEPGAASSELASADTLLVDFSGPTPKFAAAAPGLAASWLGYGQNPGFYDQDPPLSALPAFASSLGREAVLGPTARVEAIRRALQVIPRTPPTKKPEDMAVIRAKSFLFFYGLEDRYGRDVFRHAIDHMLEARRGGGFGLADLIAAFEQETHQNVAEFERLWMKRPGVPEEFRARYENSAAALAVQTKENRP